MDLNLILLEIDLIKQITLYILTYHITLPLLKIVWTTPWLFLFIDGEASTNSREREKPTQVILRRYKTSLLIKQQMHLASQVCSNLDWI